MKILSMIGSTCNVVLVIVKYYVYEKACFDYHALKKARNMSRLSFSSSE